MNNDEIILKALHNQVKVLILQALVNTVLLAALIGSLSYEILEKLK